MDEIVIPLTVGTAYENELVSLKPAEAELRIPLIAGGGRVSTTPVVIGALSQFGGHAIEASLSLSYEFDATRRLLKISAWDHASPEAPRMSARAAGASEEWTYRSPLYPGLDAGVDAAVRSVIQKIKGAAKAKKLNLLVRTNPPTLPPDLYKRLCPVYKDGKFVEFYDPSKSYSKEYTLGDFGSIFYGEIELDPNEAFSNVIGSTDDPKVGGQTWIQLWMSQFGDYGLCTSYETAGEPGGEAGEFECTEGGRLFGGHSVLGEIAMEMPVGSDVVFIMPICPAHNNDDSVYMEAVTETRGVALHNYMQRGQMSGASS